MAGSAALGLPQGSSATVPGMSTHFSFDRESFQRFLESAFAVQESGLDSQSLCSLLQLQRAMATGETDEDSVMHLIAEHARNVAGATGVAVALLEKDQLVYRAGSGSATTYVGQRLTAVLSVAPRSTVPLEILRVENAETDARIEAAICRQRGAKSLLILPIYHQCRVAGLLEVFFSEAHTFQDPEVRIYRLMADAVEPVLFKKVQLRQEEVLASQPATVQLTVEQITAQRQDSPVRGSAPRSMFKHWTGWVRENAKAVGEFVYLRPWGKVARTPSVKRGLGALLGNVAAISAVIAIMIAGWIAYDRPSRSPVGLSAPGSNAAGPPVSPVLSPEDHTPRPRNVSSRAEDMKGRRSTFRRLRVGQNEVDYIAEDVTIRQFMPKTKYAQGSNRYEQVNIGDDVTVRYFAYKPAGALQTQPVPAAAKAVERSSSLSK